HHPPSTTRHPHLLPNASLLCGLEVFPSDTLLAVALPRSQFERQMFRTCPETAVVGVTAITNQRVADQKVKNAVEHGGAEQDGPRQPLFIPTIGENRSQAGPRQDGHAQPVGKVLLFVEFSVAADRTGVPGILRGRVDVQAMVASRTLPAGRAWQAHLAG